MSRQVIRFGTLFGGMLTITVTVLYIEGIPFFDSIGIAIITATLKSVWARIHHQIFHLKLETVAQ